MAISSGFSNGRAVATALLLPTTLAPDAIFGPIGSIYIDNLPFAHAYGTNNTFLGTSVANFTLTGNGNTGIGDTALASLTSGSDNVVVGGAAGIVITSGSFNTILGEAAGNSLLTGSNNILLGYAAGVPYTSGESNNIIIGALIAGLGTTGESNVLRIGSATGTNTAQLAAAYICGIDGVNLSSANVVTEVSNQLGTAVLTPGSGVSISTATPNQIIISASGSGGTITSVLTANATPQFALVGTVETVDFGISNLILGSLPAAITGATNTGVGLSSLADLTSGSNNTGVGAVSLSSLTSGNNNTAMGAGSLQMVTTGDDNVAIGWSSSASMVNGNFNTAVGVSSLVGAIDSLNNTALGYLSLGALRDGNNNIAVGTTSLVGLATGNNNIGIGSAVGSNYSGGESFNILLGSPGVTGESNVIRIGNQFSAGSGQNEAFMAGIVGVSPANAEVVFINSTTGQLGVDTTGIIPDSFVTNSGTAVPSAGVLNVLGSGSIATSGAGNTITITASGSGFVETITGNTGGAQSPSAGNFNFLTANATVKFAGTAATETLDFGITNLVLGSSLPSRTSGITNVGLGNLALNAITAGSSNTAIGYSTLTYATDGGGGIGSNTAVGAYTLTNLTTGTQNTAIGGGAGGTLLTGSWNTLLGKGNSAASGSAYTSSEKSNVLLANVGVVGESNVMRLGTTGTGNGQVSTTYIAGVDGVNVGSTAQVVTEVSGQFGSAVITAGTNVAITTGANTITISANATSYTENYTGITHLSSPYSATASDYYIGADVTGGVITIYLPAAPVTGRALVVKDLAGLAGTSNITVTTLAGIVNIDGGTSYALNTNYQSAQFIWSGSAWQIY